MSTISYNSNNQVPFQQPNAPPPLQPRGRRRGGGVLGANGYQNRILGANGYQNQILGANGYQNQILGTNSYQNPNQNLQANGYQNQNFGTNDYQCQNRNFRTNGYNYPNYYGNYSNGNPYFPNSNDYGMRNQPDMPLRPRYYCQQNIQRSNRNQNQIREGGRNRRNQPRNGSNQQRRSRSRQPPRQQRQPRRNGPRQIQLNDFMPVQLRNHSSSLANLPEEFQAFNSTTNANNVPVDALPQRAIFARTTTTADSTQPFNIAVADNDDEIQEQSIINNGRNQKRQTSTTTASFRRQQQRRIRQEQYRRNGINTNNRFAVLAEDNNNNDGDDYDDDDKVEDNVDNDMPLRFLKKKNNNNRKRKKERLYLKHERIIKWIHENVPQKEIIDNSGNYAFVLASINIYDEWIRANYEVQVWQNYFKMATENKHWAKEIIQRTKQRDEIVNNRFIKNKINQLALIMAQSGASISDLKTQLRTYWSQVPSYKGSKAAIDALAQGTPTTTTSSTTESTTSKITATSLAPDRIRDKVDQVEKVIYKYLYHCTEHVKMSIENRIRLAKAQLDEFKALEDFQLASTPNHRIIHFVLKSKVKLWSTKNKNRTTILKRIELDLPPKWISKCDYNLKIDASMVSPQEVQEFYNRMKDLKRKNRIEAMTIYQDIATREYELINNEINDIIINLSKQTDEDEASSAALIHYHKLREKRLNLEAEQSVPAIINEANIQLTEEYHQLLKLGPRFIYNDPKTASRRRTTELATLKRKIERQFYDKKVSPGRPVEQFIAALDKLLLKLHGSSPSNEKQQTTFNNNNNSVSTTTDNPPSQPSQLHIHNGTVTMMKKNKRKNYGRLVKRLKYKFKLANVVLRKSDKSKVFHLGKLEEYNKKSNEYMDKTKAYKCLGTQDPLADLIQRTNKYLLDLRLIKWITQKQYEQLSIKPNEVELAHLYYLPKAHKAGTPLRPIVSGLKHPTIKISKFLDQLLRPLFDQMASKTTVTSGFEFSKYVQEWSEINLRQDTLFCTIDVTDLYTMVPQVEGVLSLKKMMDYLQLKQIDGLKIETIIRLSRFVMKNNYFSYDGQYYHQIRGGAMGSPLT
ncbi:unnamed protein product, partial [Rotaria socialis]